MFNQIKKKSLSDILPLKIGVPPDDTYSLKCLNHDADMRYCFDSVAAFQVERFTEKVAQKLRKRFVRLGGTA